jgi:HEAT repeat protein
LQALKESGGPERQEAVQAWARVSGYVQAAVPALAALLKSHDPSQREQAAATLGDLGQHAQMILQMVRGALRETALRDTDDGVRTTAVAGLAALGPQAQSQMPALVEALRDEIPAVRMNAAYALGELGAEARSVSTALFMALRDADLAVQVHAAVALWKIERRDRVVVPVLAAAVRDGGEVLRWIAADCLGEIGPAARDAVPALRAALAQEGTLALVKQGLRLALERIEAAAS